MTTTPTQSHEQVAEQHSREARGTMRSDQEALVYAALAQSEATLELVYETRRVADALERIAGLS